MSLLTESKATCQYWNSITYSWQTNGCSLVNRENDIVTCACNHMLGLFAVSIEAIPTEVSEGEETSPPVDPGEVPSFEEEKYMSTTAIVLLCLVLVVLIGFLVIFFVTRRRYRKAKEEGLLEALSKEKHGNNKSSANSPKLFLNNNYNKFSDLSAQEDEDLDQEEAHAIHSSRLSRLNAGLKDESNRGYGSSLTHRKQFEASIDMDIPSPKQSTKPQTTTRLSHVRYRDSQHVPKPKESASYAASSTRVTPSATVRDSSSSRTALSNTRRLSEA
jgi:hypothetical protein